MRIASLSVASLLALSACAGSDEQETDTTTDTDTSGDTDTAVADTSIIGVAAAAGDFTTLLAAVDAAGLTATLQGDGRFTVFAPTDEAFAKLPEGTVDALLQDPEALSDILLYHVVAGDVPASTVVESSLIATLQGSDLKVTVTDDGVWINDAQVTMTDIEADNGIIHVIDTVVTPPPSIAQIAAADENFSTLVAALDAADLVGTLDGEGTFTVFAPTNAAFDQLPDGTVEALLDDVPTLTNILLYHVAGEKLTAAEVVGSSEITMLNGDTAAVSLDGGASIAGAPISVTDIPAANGVIHVIDAVMLPPEN